MVLKMDSALRVLWANGRDAAPGPPIPHPRGHNMNCTVAFLYDASKEEPTVR